ncbi:hypothetical protein [Chlamydiifrater volucris]|uniref:hypothetical protein n=1 Tax=Chlamydiifrater volucris TaxID=2681470 RepID=UPI001BCCC53D|nr:hypothetical protein [Chlamydiifrater volucris]
MDMYVDIGYVEPGYSMYLVPPGAKVVDNKVRLLIKDLDPRGFLAFVPTSLFILQLIPVVGIVAGTITFRAACRNERAIRDATGLPGLDTNSLFAIRCAQAWGIFSILGLSLPIFAIVLAIALVIATILLLTIGSAFLVSKIVQMKNSHKTFLPTEG